MLITALINLVDYLFHVGNCYTITNKKINDISITLIKNIIIITLIKSSILLLCFSY